MNARYPGKQLREEICHILFKLKISQNEILFYFPLSITKKISSKYFIYYPVREQNFVTVTLTMFSIF